MFLYPSPQTVHDTFASHSFPSLHSFRSRSGERARLPWGWIPADIHLSPLYFPPQPCAVTAALRQVPGLFLARTTTTALPRDGHISRSEPSLPSLGRQASHRASYVHTAVRIVAGRRLPLYAHKAQTQCPRQQPMVYTPVTSAVWPASRGRFIEANENLNYLLPHPISVVSRVSKVRTLHTRVPCVAIASFRLGASRRNGVPTFCPVFSGLQTGSCSGPPPARSAWASWGRRSLNSGVFFPPFSLPIEHYHCMLRSALTPPCGVPSCEGVKSHPSNIPAMSHARMDRLLAG